MKIAWRTYGKTSSGPIFAFRVLEEKEKKNGKK